MLSSYTENDEFINAEEDIKMKMMKYCPNKAIKKKKQSCTKIELINSFKQLGNLPFNVAIASITKSKETSKLKSPLFPFTPTLNQQSQLLAKVHMKKCIEIFKKNYPKINEKLDGKL